MDRHVHPRPGRPRPAHAADLAAAEAQRYAPPRPLQEALAELHHAWTVEQDCVERLARDQHYRDQLCGIIAITTERDATLPPLKAAYHTARLHADQATRHHEQIEAVIDAQIRHISDHLRRTWDGQRPTARAAADTIRAGSGRLGQHRRAVRDAREHLRQWAGTWRPILPELPTELDSIVAVAAGFDDTTRVHDAFGQHVRHIAEQAHPDHAPARDAAQAAKAAAAQAWVAVQSLTDHYQRQLWRHGTVAHTPQPDQTLDRLTHRIADTQRRLNQARADLTTLTREPALRTLPADRLKAERDTWHADRTAQRRTATTHAARTNPSTVRGRPTNDSLLPPPSPAPRISL